MLLLTLLLILIGSSISQTVTCGDVKMLYMNEECCTLPKEHAVSCAVNARDIENSLDTLQSEVDKFESYAKSYLNYLEEIAKDNSYLNQPGKMSLPVIGFPDRTLDEARELLGITDEMSSAGIKIMLIDDYFTPLVLDHEAGEKIDDPRYSRVTYSAGVTAQRYERFRDLMIESSLVNDSITNEFVNIKITDESTHGNAVYYWMKNLIPNATFHFLSSFQGAGKFVEKNDTQGIANFMRSMFEFAEEMGVNVISASWGVGYDTNLTSLSVYENMTNITANIIDEYYDKGIIWFNAAGNNPKLSRYGEHFVPRYKDISKAVTVGSLANLHTAVVGATGAPLEQNLYVQGENNGFKMLRNTPDVIAPTYTISHTPGSLLYKIQNGDPNIGSGGLRSSGLTGHATSWACPIAAAAFALGFHNSPGNLTIQEYHYRFLRTAMFGDYKTTRFGYGIPDVSRSLDPQKPPKVFGTQRILNDIQHELRKLNLSVPSPPSPPSTGLRWADPIPQKTIDFLWDEWRKYTEQYTTEITEDAFEDVLNPNVARWTSGTEITEGTLAFILHFLSPLGVTRELLYPLPSFIKELTGGELVEPTSGLPQSSPPSSSPPSSPSSSPSSPSSPFDLELVLSSGGSSSGFSFALADGSDYSSKGTVVASVVGLLPLSTYGVINPVDSTFFAYFKEENNAHATLNFVNPTSSIIATPGISALGVSFGATPYTASTYPTGKYWGFVTLLTGFSEDSYAYNSSPFCIEVTTTSATMCDF